MNVKRTYVAPTMVAVDIEPNTMIAASVPITDEEKPMGTNKYREGWNYEQWYDVRKWN